VSARNPDGRFRSHNRPLTLSAEMLRSRWLECLVELDDLLSDSVLSLMIKQSADIFVYAFYARSASSPGDGVRSTANLARPLSRDAQRPDGLAERTGFELSRPLIQPSWMGLNPCGNELAALLVADA
jgi:hypothetical protein